MLTEECTIDDIKESQFLGLLFSAHWGPPCRTFLSILKDFYSEVNIDEKKCEVLFLSMDKSLDDFDEHYKSMPWLALPFNNERCQKLKAHFDITGIPIFVVVDSQTGELVTMRGRKDLHEKSYGSIEDWVS